MLMKTLILAFACISLSLIYSATPSLVLIQSPPWHGRTSPPPPITVLPAKPPVPLTVAYFFNASSINTPSKLRGSAPAFLCIQLHTKTHTYENPNTCFRLYFSLLAYRVSSTPRFALLYATALLKVCMSRRKHFF